ncbi:ATP-dependent DNA helicase RecG [Hylemonella gracilis]|uniref:ATP-dependent DNA helicase RecG n=2 Tax=Hylemonella gracilis TaxID=80880 RepID=A0A4P6UPS4_9BURK|nr:ATP-dependent DNA helicase RecG [Hylemonella gracilis]QBK06320.1 ATP-dependent DNA helicase RecG [Hylemonella gracilis]
MQVRQDKADKPLSAPQKAMRRLGLDSDMDLALHLPLRYEDETRLMAIAELRDGDLAQIEGVVRENRVEVRARRQLIVRIEDAAGHTLLLRFLNFYPSQQKLLAVGQRVRVRGEVRGGFLGREMVHPECKAVQAGAPLAQALTPVYPTTAGLPQAYLRKAVGRALDKLVLDETLPPQALQSWPGGARVLADWSLHAALDYLHHPGPEVSLAALQDRSHPAWLRLKAEELLAQQLSQLQARQAQAQRRAPALALGRPGGETEGLHEKLLAVLPFALTAAQRRVSEEIAQDLARPSPMHRLLQGDVGSGKTVVAALAAAVCIDAGYQCVLMAPTEILASQHVKKLVDWLAPLGVRVAWLAGGQKTRERRETLEAIDSGQAQLIVGTHAVIQDKVHFHRLGLAIVDEQHRFGVAQRLALREKVMEGSDPRSGAAWGPVEPHMLMMTATPIPRTLAMSYYADLDVSTLDELPPGRSPIVTRVISEQRRPELIDRIRAQLADGRQVYWVCPLIEESEAVDLTNATATHAELTAALNHGAHAAPRGGECSIQVGLLHSRLPAAEKQAVMAEFVAGRMGLLVSTTVIEVGVDVPNATLMVIEHAERFGLSQLHQLRGRVGRGAQASACVLLYSTGDAPRLGQTARERLKAMAETNDGFEIARRDLEIRGPGEFLGARQSGAALLRFADLATDGEVLDWARQTAALMLAQHPALAERHVARWLGGRVDYLKA